jgi:hypothetical protein
MPNRQNLHHGNWERNRCAELSTSFENPEIKDVEVHVGQKGDHLPTPRYDIG